VQCDGHNAQQRQPARLASRHQYQAAPQGPVTVGALVGTCVIGYESSPYSQFHPGTPHGTVPALSYQVTISHPHGSGTVQTPGYTVRFYNAAGALVGTQHADTTGSFLGDVPTDRSFTWTVLSATAVNGSTLPTSVFTAGNPGLIPGDMPSDASSCQATPK
jgi:hypothetical protein